MPRLDRGPSQRDASLVVRALRAIRDGSFATKIFNRILRAKAPAPAPDIDRLVARHFPADQWKRLSPEARKAWVQFAPVLQACRVHKIAYVGAYLGATATALDEAFPDLEFHLLEPIPAVFESLTANVRGRPNMHSINVAAGAEESRCDMFVDRYAPASSLLPYEPIALKEFPFLGQHTRVSVQVRRLDDVLADCGAGPVEMLLMDVQGYEDEVLRGAPQTLRSCRVVMSELSLQPLYAGSSTFDSVYQALEREGFRLRYLMNPLTGESQQIMQVDGVFVRGCSP